jgi:hypothetical protein
MTDKTKPTPEQLAFHEEVKTLLLKHQEQVNEVAVAAILSQVAGSTLAISMVYDGLHTKQAVDIIVGNAKLGIETGLNMIHAGAGNPS